MQTERSQAKHPSGSQCLDRARGARSQRNEVAAPQQARCKLDTGNEIGDLGAKACPKALIVGVEHKKCDFIQLANKVKQGSKHSRSRMGCSYLAWLSKAGSLSVPFPEFSLLFPFSIPYRFPEPCTWHLLLDVRYLNLELYFL